MADMRTIATAWEARATDVNRYNAAGALTFAGRRRSVGDVGNACRRPTSRCCHHNDGWNHNWPTHLGRPVPDYVIISYGKDGAKDGSRTQRSDHQLRLRHHLLEGSFLQYPEGVQTQ